MDYKDPVKYRIRFTSESLKHHPLVAYMYIISHTMMISLHIRYVDCMNIDIRPLENYA